MIKESSLVAFRILLGLVVLVIVVAGLVLAQPIGPVRRAKNPVKADPARLREHVTALCALVPRNLSDPAKLAAAARYVRVAWEKAGIEVTEQKYTVDRHEVSNVIAAFGPKGGQEGGEMVVVGAHYDAYCAMPGADDNASGVAGLIELGRALAKKPLRSRVELVAFTLEEPPYFGGPQMGSAVHAASLKKRGVKVRAMLGLEMIGTFSDAKGSQAYPVPALSLIYPTRGDFIVVAGRLGDWRVARITKRALASIEGMRARSINAPVRFSQADLSDHANYWREGFPAVMVSDTAFFRNFTYHTPEDTPERLDYIRMARVVEGLVEAVTELAGGRCNTHPHLPP